MLVGFSDCSLVAGQHPVILLNCCNINDLFLGHLFNEVPSNSTGDNRASWARRGISQRLGELGDLQVSEGGWVSSGINTDLNGLAI